MNQANEPAFPEPFLNEPHLALSTKKGLTKREYFASKILQAMLSNPAIVQHSKDRDSYLTSPVVIAGLCVHSRDYADQLLKALEQ